LKRIGGCSASASCRCLMLVKNGYWLGAAGGGCRRRGSQQEKSPPCLARRAPCFTRRVHFDQHMMQKLVPCETPANRYKHTSKPTYYQHAISLSYLLALRKIIKMCTFLTFYTAIIVKNPIYPTLLALCGRGDSSFVRQDVL
jgi:hypothetical protein